MATKLEEITAVFVRETWRSENGEGDFFFGICRPATNGSSSPLFSSEFGIACNAEPGEIKSGMEYRWWGKREEDPKWGPKLKVSTFTLARPHSMTGVVKYLQECPHIGQATATAIWNKFRGDSVRILRESPEVVSSSINRFPLDKATEAAVKLVELSAIEDTSIEMIDLLHGRGFPKDLSRQCVKRWGNRAPEFIRRDPYILQFARGVGFLKTDSMYLDMGLPPDRMKRQVYCAWYGIASDSEGHCWLPESTAVEGIKAKVSGVAVDPAKAITIGKRAGAIATRLDCPACRGIGQTMQPDLFFGDTLVNLPCEKCGGSGGRMWIADAKKAKAEDYIARRVADMLTWESHWPSLDHPAFERLTDHQREELAKAMTGAIGSLGGSPGSGKSFSLAALANCLVKLHGPGSVAIAAPTGKAAVRCKEAMAAYGVDVEPKTIHRTLGVLSADDGWSFNHKERNPLPIQFLILDECFDYEQRILTENGQEKIGAVVNQKKQVRVWSRNPATGMLELKPIVRWLKKPHPGNLIRIEATSHLGLHGARVIRCTPNHKVLTVRGYVEAGKLKVGDKIVVRGADLTAEQKSVVVGSVFGDGSLQLAASNTPRLTFSHGHKQREYLTIKRTIFGDLASKEVQLDTENRKWHTGPAYGFNLKCNDYTRRLFREKRRVLGGLHGQWSPSDALIESIDEHALAIWYMDDGGIGERKPLAGGGVDMSAIINCNIFTDADAKRLASYVSRRFSLPCVARAKRGYWGISFGRNSTRDLFDVIRPFIPACMGYKVDGKCGYLPSGERHKETCESTITSIAPWDSAYGCRESVFDIEVADFHNYVAGNIVVSNCSMIGTGLMSSALAAVGRGTNVMLVADVNQLLPVEYGAPLRDLVSIPDFPYGQLTKIHRNAGTIVRACKAIREQQAIPLDEEIDPEPACPTCGGSGIRVVVHGQGEHGDCEQESCDDCYGGIEKLPPQNLKLIAASKDSAPRKLLDLVGQIRDAGQFDPIWGVQVCVAVNKRSALSRESLNKQLQEILNPNGATVKGSPFRVGDKCIMLKNTFLKLDTSYRPPSKPVMTFVEPGGGLRRIGGPRPVSPNDFEYAGSPAGRNGKASGGNEDEKVLVCNGEFGRVLEVHEKKTIVEFMNPSRIVLIPRGKQEGDEDAKKSGGDDESPATGCDMSLGYACTVHKMQGSSAPCCIVCVDEYPGASGSHGICDRAWLYTAISRAEKVCYLIGKRSTMQGIVARQYITRRKTFLVEKIGEYQRDMAAGEAAKWEPELAEAVV